MLRIYWYFFSYQVRRLGYYDGAVTIPLGLAYTNTTYLPCCSNAISNNAFVS